MSSLLGPLMDLLSSLEPPFSTNLKRAESINCTWSMAKIIRVRASDLRSTWWVMRPPSLMQVLSSETLQQSVAQWKGLYKPCSNKNVMHVYKPYSLVKPTYLINMSRHWRQQILWFKKVLPKSKSSKTPSLKWTPKWRKLKSRRLLL